MGKDINVLLNLSKQVNLGSKDTVDLTPPNSHKPKPMSFDPLRGDVTTKFFDLNAAEGEEASEPAHAAASPHSSCRKRKKSRIFRRRITSPACCTFPSAILRYLLRWQFFISCLAVLPGAATAFNWWPFSSGPEVNNNNSSNSTNVALPSNSGIINPGKVNEGGIPFSYQLPAKRNFLRLAIPSGYSNVNRVTIQSGAECQIDPQLVMNEWQVIDDIILADTERLNVNMEYLACKCDDDNTGICSPFATMVVSSNKVFILSYDGSVVPATTSESATLQKQGRTACSPSNPVCNQPNVFGSGWSSSTTNAMGGFCSIHRKRDVERLMTGSNGVWTQSKLEPGISAIVILPTDDNLQLYVLDAQSMELIHISSVAVSGKKQQVITRVSSCAGAFDGDAISFVVASDAGLLRLQWKTFADPQTLNSNEDLNSIKDLASTENCLIATDTRFSVVYSLDLRTLVEKDRLGIKSQTGSGDRLRRPSAVICAAPDLPNSYTDCYFSDEENDRLIWVRVNDTDCSMNRKQDYITEGVVTKGQRLLPSSVNAPCALGLVESLATQRILTVAGRGAAEYVTLTQTLENGEVGELTFLGQTTAESLWPYLEIGKSLSFNTGEPAAVSDPSREILLTVGRLAALDATVTRGIMLYGAEVFGDISPFGYPPTREYYVAGQQSLTLTPYFSTVKSPATEFTVKPPLPQGISLNSSTGYITGTPALPLQKTQFTVTGWHPLVQPVANFTLLVFCPAGQFMNVYGRCEPCAFGSYNAPGLTSDPGACVPCGDNFNTTATGADSFERCTCNPGFQRTVDDTTTCEPCPPGSYKEETGEICYDSCPQFSSTFVIGAVTAADRQCSCESMYYQDPPTAAEEYKCVPCAPNNFCPGGYQEPQQSCPAFSVVEANSAKSADDCQCQVGYEDIRDNKKDGQGPVCHPCQEGYYRDTADDQPCKKCPTGSSTSGTGHVAVTECSVCDQGYAIIGLGCDECPIGSYCLGQLPPIRCPDMATTSGLGSRGPEDCVCDKGHYAVDAGLSTHTCLPCDIGEYKGDIGNEACVVCENDKSTEKQGSDANDLCICVAGWYESHDGCYLCPRGSWCPGKETTPRACLGDRDTQDVGSTQESDCLCGMGYEPGAGGCVPCKEDFFKTTFSNDMCESCPLLSSTEGMTGAQSASDCKCNKGTYYDDKLRWCVDCPPTSYYCPGGDQSVGPQPCPHGSQVAMGETKPDSLSHCVCQGGFGGADEGEWASSGGCTLCPEGYFKGEVGNSTCYSKCPEGSTSLSGAVSVKQCFCLKSFFYAESACYECPEGAVCVGGLTPEAMDVLAHDAQYTAIRQSDHEPPRPLPGYYVVKHDSELINRNSWEFVQCPFTDACLGWQPGDADDNNCFGSMEGLLCAECKQGFSNKASKSSCGECQSFGMNALMLVGYFIGVLVCCFVMTQLNVSAGFNRRTIHSIVIKIGLNYYSSSAIVREAGFSNLKWPSWLQFLSKNSAVHLGSTGGKGSSKSWMSVDCFLRDLRPGMTHAQAFFYSSIVWISLPIVIPALLTLLIVPVFLYIRNKEKEKTTKRLVVLRHVAQKGLHDLYRETHKELANARIMTLFRYIRMPKWTRWRMVRNFIEDMIPMYIASIFFVYTTVTKSSLKLWQCLEVAGSRQLEFATSVQCSVEDELFQRFLIVGVGGFILFGFGIPAFSFFVLFVNRHNLNDDHVRLRYGFLNNGYETQYWYWELVNYIRKNLVLLTSNLNLLGSDAVQIWFALMVALSCAALHFACRPFDKRNYGILDRLEDHGLLVWVISLLAVQLLFMLRGPATLNVCVVGGVLLLNLAYAVDVALALYREYTNYVRTQQQLQSLVWPIGPLFKFMAKRSEARRSKELLVQFDPERSRVRLVAGQRHRLFNMLRVKHREIGSMEREYCVVVLAEAISNAMLHVGLADLPAEYFEFMLRWSCKVHNDGQQEAASQTRISDLVVGHLKAIVEWEAQRRREKAQRSQKAAAVERALDEDWRVKDDDEDEEEHSNASSEKEEETKPQRKGEEAEAIAMVQALKGQSDEVAQLLDNEKLSGALPIADLYLAVYQLQLKAPDAMRLQLQAYCACHQAQVAEEERLLKKRLRKLVALERLMEKESDLTLKPETLGYLKALNTWLKGKLQRLKDRLNDMEFIDDSSLLDIAAAGDGARVAVEQVLDRMALPTGLEGRKPHDEFKYEIDQTTGKITRYVKRVGKEEFEEETVLEQKELETLEKILEEDVAKYEAERGRRASETPAFVKTPERIMPQELASPEPIQPSVNRLATSMRQSNGFFTRAFTKRPTADAGGKQPAKDDWESNDDEESSSDIEYADKEILRTL